MTITDPGLRFWLRYVEDAGALCETAEDSVLVLLPDRLQAAFDLPEETAVTGDPAVAREDGALLLLSGHPALERAVRDVLDAGDVGHTVLAWPSAPAPDADLLLARARETFGVDHGRIDAAGEPTAAFLPVLIVGVLVNYTLSLDDHFQEELEVWVDARGSAEIPADARSRLRRAATGPAQARPMLPADVPAALVEADRLLTERAARRRRELSRPVDAGRSAELARTEAYYAESLASLTRRRSSAPPDKTALLDARIAATDAERVRRLAEVADKYRGRHTIRPYRLHQLLVPALTLPVDVRRGDRRYPLALDWMLPAGAFRGVRCPQCGANAQLVAAKDRLGCRCCLVRTTTEPTPAPVPPAARAARPQPAPRPPTAPPVRAVPPKPASRPPARAAAARSAPVPADRAKSPRQVRAAGDRLAMSYWEWVAGGDRRLRRLLAPDSPAAAVDRLYGATGSAWAIGVGETEMPVSVSAGTEEPVPGAAMATVGDVRTARYAYPFQLRWRFVDGAAVVEEVLPFPFAWSGGRLPAPTWLPTAERLLHDVPKPRIELDPVARVLWKVDLPRLGLPLLLRCLAAWWRVRDAVDLASEPVQQTMLFAPSEPTQPAVLAAAVARLVALRAGGESRYDVVAAWHGVDPGAVRAAGAALQKQLQLSATRWW